MNEPIEYPETERDDVVEGPFGVNVADPYRWLENDVREDQRVRDWVTAQNAVTRDYLEGLPGRTAIRERLTELWDYERIGLPKKRGDRYFYNRNAGLENQPPLYLRETIDGEARLLIDPNSWSDDHATAMAEWEPSPDGSRLVYGVQEGGTDWRILQVLDVESGETLSDRIEWAKFTHLAWARNGAGFFYSRFPEPESGEFQSLNSDHAIYFHIVGTDQAADRLVYATPDRPDLNHVAEVTDDGGWLVIYSFEGTDERYELTILDLTARKMKFRTIVRGLDYDWSLAGNEGPIFYFRTDRDAARGRIVKINVATQSRATSGVVPEDEAVLTEAALIGGRLIASYLVDAKSVLRVHETDGRRVGEIGLPGIGTVDGIEGRGDDPECFFGFSSFTTPTAIYRHDISTGETRPFAKPRAAFDPRDYTIEQHFYRSKDGTRVPLFVVHRADIDRGSSHPTLLYGYGGFRVSLTPAFSPAALQWMEMGGNYAVANIRGGGEYGKAWHEAGRLENKQNVFDDFIAAAEYLVSHGITSREQLAIRGGSNGGLLVGTVVNQRPELFAAALPAVGVMDMLRFDRFTAGRYWVDDYGRPGREKDFHTLFAYSPYHNIARSGDYPAIMVTTADTDDRVVPGHSFKYAAALQHADLGDRPRLIRIETRAGHGAGRPTNQLIEEYADLWAFAAHWTGLAADESDKSAE